MSTQHSAEIAHLHWIEVERDEEGPISVRFVCKGDDSAACHHWPDCECEAWGPEHGWPDGEPMPGHGNVQQSSCWIDPWFNDGLSHVQDWLDSWEGDEDAPGLDDLISGPIEYLWQGDYMTWEYASGVVSPPGLTTPTPAGGAA